MKKDIIDTIYTTSNMQENLSSLDKYIATVNYNIEILNKYARINYEALNARI